VSWLRSCSSRGDLGRAGGEEAIRFARTPSPPVRTRILQARSSADHRGHRAWRRGFAADTTLDLPGLIEQARSLASELSAGLSVEQLDGTQMEAKELRNHAFSALEQLVTDVREAGRYALRDDASAKRFTSDYLRRKRATALRKRGTDATESPTS
jgi:hypothetical protein